MSIAAASWNISTKTLYEKKNQAKTSTDVSRYRFSLTAFIINDRRFFLDLIALGKSLHKLCQLLEAVTANVEIRLDPLDVLSRYTKLRKTAVISVLLGRDAKKAMNDLDI